jgi:hypothetical protein
MTLKEGRDVVLTEQGKQIIPSLRTEILGGRHGGLGLIAALGL